MSGSNPPEAGTFKNTQPVEVDANTAAAELLEDNFPDQIVAIAASDDAPLTRPGAPSNPESLLSRELRMLADRRAQLTASAVREGKDVESVVSEWGQHSDDALRLWTEMTG